MRRLTISMDNAATSRPQPAAMLEAMRRFIEKVGANPGRSGHCRRASRPNNGAHCALPSPLLLDREVDAVVPLRRHGGQRAVFVHLCHGESSSAKQSYSPFLTAMARPSYSTQSLLSGLVGVKLC